MLISTTTASPYKHRARQLRKGGDDGIRLGERVAWWKVRVRDRDAAHAGGLGGTDAVVRILDRDAFARRDREPPRNLEVDVGRRLTGGDLLGRRRRVKARDDAARL